MDGKGRYSDNIFVERLWRTVKYETVYLKAYTDGRQAKADLAAYFRFYDTQRPTRPLATEHRSRCSTGTWYNHPNTPQKGEIQRYSWVRPWLPLVRCGHTGITEVHVEIILQI